MSIPSRARAEQILAKIRSEKGYISDEYRARTLSSVLEALRNVRSQLGIVIGFIAQDLFSSDALFVYELVQNAEDNKYPIGASLCLNFAILPRHLVIESNENGFTERDVRSLCSTAQSSKAKGQGYIGHKGVGFKLVFKIDKKATILESPQFRHQQLAEHNSPRGRESADFVYVDTEGASMQLLIAKCYISSIHSDYRLKFYIEVKTTTGADEDPFFVSSKQYEMMEELKRSFEYVPNEAYLIIRISQITGDEVELSIFFDPLTARKEGELDFKIGTYTARPLRK